MRLPSPIWVLVVVFNGGITTDAWNTAIGTILVLGAALSFALYQLLAKNFIGADGLDVVHIGRHVCRRAWQPDPLVSVQRRSAAGIIRRHI